MLVLQCQASPLEESQCICKFATSDVSNQEIIPIFPFDHTELRNHLGELSLLFSILFNVLEFKLFNLFIPNKLHVVYFRAIRFYRILQFCHHFSFQQVVSPLDLISKLI